MFNPDDIDEDYIVWCVAHDEYYGYDDETDAQHAHSSARA